MTIIDSIIEDGIQYIVEDLLWDLNAEYFIAEYRDEVEDYCTPSEWCSDDTPF